LIYERHGVLRNKAIGFEYSGTLQWENEEIIASARRARLTIARRFNGG